MLKLEDVIMKELNQKLEIKLVLLIGRNVDKGFKYVNGVFIAGVDSRGGWGVDRVTGAGNGSADGITFGLDDWYVIRYYDGLFDGFSVGKPMR